MENNTRTKDISSDSENSEWAVIDEDSSLEWNDEAKYHFRLSKRGGDVIIPREDTTFAVNGNTSDEDSIEVVSDIGYDDQVMDDVDSIGSVIRNDDATDNVQSCIAHDNAAEMVWYRLGDLKKTKKDGKNILESKANPKKQNALNLNDNWDLVAILLVALIGGFAFGYFCGSHYNDVQPSSLLINKLRQENKLQRNNLHDAYRCIRYPLSCGIMTIPDDRQNMTSNIVIKSLNSIKSESNLEPVTGATTGLVVDTVSNMVEADSVVASEISTPVVHGFKELLNDKKKSLSNYGNPHITIPEVIQEEWVVKHVEGKILLEKIKPEIIQSDSLKVGIEKISRLVGLHENFSSDAGLMSNLELLRKLDFSVQVLDSIYVETMPPKDLKKVTNYKAEIQKASRKLIRRIDNSVNKFIKHLVNKLNESNRVFLKNVCKQWSIVDKDNAYRSKLSADMVFDACNRSKLNLKQAEDPANIETPTSKKIVKYSSSKGEHVANDDIVTSENNLNEHDKIQSETGKHKYKKTAVADSATIILPAKEEGCQGKKDVCKYRRNVENNSNNGKQHHSINRKRENKGNSLPANYKEAEQKKSGYLKEQNLISESAKVAFKDGSLSTSNDSGDKCRMGKPDCKTKGSYIRENNGNSVCNDSPKAPETRDEMLKSGQVMSNKSGEWVFKMGNSRAKQRHQDHQSDWLFERAESRKCHRGNKDCKESLYPKNLCTRDEMLKSGQVMSNKSGEWVFKMGNSRAKQRHQDHQSDWLFERSESRKCHRGKKDCKESLYPKNFPSQFKYNSGDSRGGAPKENKYWLKDLIPNSFVEAAKIAKNTFKKFHHNIKQRTRRQ